MTPTLSGRIQTRFLLLSTLGLVITLWYGYRVTAPDYTTPLALLCYVMLFGIVWDIIYAWCHGFRWDRDWPTSFLFGSGITEGLFLWGAIVFFREWHPWGMTHLPGVAPELMFATFAFHYIPVWLITFLATQGPLRILFLRWRYDGGEWV